jgi:hypothetical protein
MTDPTPLPAAPDWRALCQELLQPLAEYDGANPYHEHRDLITRVRTALAQSKPAKNSAECSTYIEALKAIAQYGSDTLSGRIDGPDDREWQRDAVREMTNRADAALATTPARLRQCPTHGQQPENAWGCPECVRELREELAATEESSVAQSNPTPPEGLTDEQLDALERQHWEATGFLTPTLQKEELFNYRAFARAAIAAHDAARAPAQLPTPEEIETRFHAWWADSYPSVPVSPRAVASYTDFALYLLGQEVA